MYKTKKYGQSMVAKCFCGKIGTVKNSQGVPVCSRHRNSKLENLKCVCGELLDLQLGKWGPYFRCLNCGNISFRKALEINPQIKPKSNTEMTIRSDQLDFI